MLASIVLCLAGRAVHIFPLACVANLGRQEGDTLPLNMQIAIWFAGLR